MFILSENKKKKMKETPFKKRMRKMRRRASAPSEAGKGVGGLHFVQPHTMALHTQQFCTGAQSRGITNSERRCQSKKQKKVQGGGCN
jgi:hypothetical protein